MLSALGLLFFDSGQIGPRIIAPKRPLTRTLDIEHHNCHCARPIPAHQPAQVDAADIVEGVVLGSLDVMLFPGEKSPALTC